MKSFAILVGRLSKSVALTKYFFKVPQICRFMPLVGGIGRLVESPLQSNAGKSAPQYASISPTDGQLLLGDDAQKALSDLQLAINNSQQCPILKPNSLVLTQLGFRVAPTKTIDVLLDFLKKSL